MNYKHLVISGGGIKGFISIGAIKYLEEICLLRNFISYTGSSVGAILVFLISIGYTSTELINIILKIDVMKYLTVDIDNIYTNLGIYSTDNLVKLIKSMGIQKNIPYDCTFQKHYELTNKKLQIVGTNLTKSRCEIFSYEKTPDMKIYDAIRITFNVPFLFTRCMYNGCLYVDGGITNNAPMELTDDINKTLGIILSVDFNNKCNGIVDYINLLTKVLIKDHVIYKKYQDNCINLYLPDFQSFNFDINLEKKIEMIEKGYQLSKVFFDNKLRKESRKRILKKFFNYWKMII